MLDIGMLSHDAAIHKLLIFLSLQFDPACAKDQNSSDASGLLLWIHA